VACGSTPGERPSQKKERNRASLSVLSNRHLVSQTTVRRRRGQGQRAFYQPIFMSVTDHQTQQRIIETMQRAQLNAVQSTRGGRYIRQVPLVGCPLNAKGRRTTRRLLPNSKGNRGRQLISSRAESSVCVGVFGTKGCDCAEIEAGNHAVLCV
jgi:hypothetical protein